MTRIYLSQVRGFWAEEPMRSLVRAAFDAGYWPEERAHEVGPEKQ